MAVLEISDLGCYLATYRGFITLSVKGVEIKRISFDHVDSIISKAHGISYSQNLLVKLAQYNIPVVITDSRFMPVSMIMPIAAHHATTRHLAAQISAGQGLRNQLWQRLIKGKIKCQAMVLTQLGISNELDLLVEQVNSGDSRNIEAQAARKYWLLLFGNQFRRDRDGSLPNEMLNYGYTIMRSAIARAICATGLHPALGIHHKHPRNAFCLVDDLIEPYRPIVDYAVYHLLEVGEHGLTSKAKALLVGLLSQNLRLGRCWLSAENTIQALAQSLSKAYLNESTQLKLFKPNLIKINFDIK